jgi:hypothetical protein
MSLDAHGRVMPCATAPSDIANLVFSRYPGEENYFNSDKYKLARLFFADPTKYYDQVADLPFDSKPFCADCQSPNGKLDISTEENVRNILNNFDLFAPLNEHSKRILTEW